MDCLYEELMQEGKKLAAEGKLYESLSKFEHAKKIQETPKVLQRIKKLKDFIKEHKPSKSRLTISGSTTDDSFANRTNSFKEPASQPKSYIQTEKRKTSAVLNEIQNVTTTSNSPAKIPSSVQDLSPEQQARFNVLKKEAMSFSYEGKFEEALEKFKEALKLCDCSVVKKYIKEIQLMLSKHSKKLEEFKHLTDTGKKLAQEGKPTESLGRLKNAFEICPSPKVSRIIKTLEGQNDSISKKLFSEKEEMADFVTPKSFNETSANFSMKNFKSSDQSPNELSDLSPGSLNRYKTLYKKARTDASEGNLQESLQSLKKASIICKTDKIINRIKDLEEHIRKSETDASEEMIAVADGFSIFHEIYEKLYPYQRTGVAWLWGLFKKRKGGVLGDDMGLGKTFQVIAFLSGLIDDELVKHILIIMPVSLLTNWENEFKRWCPGIKVSLFHGSSKKERERNAIRVQKRGHVLLTSYGMVVNNKDNLYLCEGEQFIWDYVILDEGHKIKNPTKTTKAVYEIPAKNRLVLTGTPIQNNLRELWSLYDFVHQGALLGSMRTFKMNYENIITRAREKDATVGEKRLGTEMAENLKKLIQPYFLRRTKAEIWGDDAEKANIEDIECKMSDLKLSENNKVTARKNDLIIWLPLSKQQCEIYSNFLHSEAVKKILVSRRSPLVELTTLKKICDHPRLLSQRACLQLGLNGELNQEDLMKELEDESTIASSIENVSDETLIEESEKIRFLIDLLENLRENGHRTLVFSLSRKILDMIHRILTNKQWKVIRIDGTISKTEERERRIQLFQKDPSYPVFLLTTQVGGVGITLTAADRVIIYDPSWNPATDAQAVDRAYRIGQKRDVIIYRLLTCGTVEEKIYRRQIFKDSITRQATGASDPYRYFSKQELRELFTFESSEYSATQVQLSRMHSDQRKTDVSLDEHIAFLHSLNIFGISDHDLMFSKNVIDDMEDNDESAISHDYIKRQVAAAQERIQAEAAVVEDGLRLAGSYSRPYLESIPAFKKDTVKDQYQPPNLPEVIDLIEKSPEIQKVHSVRYSNEDENDDVFSPVSVDPVTSTNDASGNEPSSHVIANNITPTYSYQHLTIEKNKITDYFPVPTDQQQNSDKIDSLSITKDHGDHRFNCEKTEKQSVVSTFMPDESVTILESSCNLSPLDCEANENKNKNADEIEKMSILSTSVHSKSATILDSTSVFSETNSEVRNQTDKNHEISSNCFIECDESVLPDKFYSSQLSLQANVSCEESGVSENSKVPDSKHELSFDERLTKKRKVSSDAQLANSPVKDIQNSYQDLKTSLHFVHELHEDVATTPQTIEDAAHSRESLSNLCESDHVMTSPAKSKLNASKETFSETENPSNSKLFQLSNTPNRSLQAEKSSHLSSKLESSDIGDKSSSSKFAVDTNEKLNLHSSIHDMDTDTAVNDEEADVELSHVYGKVGKLSNEAELNDFDSIFNSFTNEHRTSSPIGDRTPNLQENLAELLHESLNLYDEPVHVKRNRVSCARRMQVMAESDSSSQASCTSSANASHDDHSITISDSEDDNSDAYDPEQSIASISLNDSVSFVPSTPVNIPHHPRSSTLVSSPRITPLRLHKSYIPPNSPFAKALATSPLIHVHNNEATLLETSMASDIDSPLQQKRMNRRKAIISDSEESEGETTTIPSSQTSFRRHLRKLSEIAIISSDEDESVNESNYKTPKSQPDSVMDISNLSTSSEDSY